MFKYTEIKFLHVTDLRTAYSFEDSSLISRLFLIRTFKQKMLDIHMLLWGLITSQDNKTTAEYIEYIKSVLH